MVHRPSSVDRLPAEIKETIGRLRQEGRTIDEIMAKLEELNADVSRSALGRHVKKLAVVGERMRRSKDLAVALTARLGDEPDNRLVAMNLELMHGMVFDLLTAAGDDDDGEDNGEGAPVFLDAKQAKFLSETIRNLASAAKTDADRVLRIKAEALKAAAAKTDELGKQLGWSADTAAKVRSQILGIG